MFTSVLNSVTRLGQKYSYIKEKSWYKKIVPFYGKMRASIERFNFFIQCLRTKPDADTVAFYTRNSKRVEAVAGLLADEQSRREYLGMVKFWQSRRRKDYPACDWKSPQYFIKEMEIGDNEVFVDCGAYSGDTIASFLEHIPRYKRIIAIEPDTKNFAALKQTHGNNPKIEMFNVGVYDADGEVRFSAGSGMASEITDDPENTVTIPVKAIDSLNLGSVSFLKMDVEGVELKALKGAEKTIRRDKPKLAICIYHSKEDMVEVAEYVHALVPEYRLYIRHHTKWPCCFETVLYARMP